MQGLVVTEQIINNRLIEVYFNDSQNHILKHAKDLLLSGKYEECLNFIKFQPDDLIFTSPHILVCQAAAMLFSECPQKTIEAVLIKAEELNDADSLAGEIAAIRAVICSYTDDPTSGIKLSEMALQKIDDENTYFKNIIQRNLGVAYTIKNDLKNANHWFEKLLMSSFQLDDWGGVLASYNYLTYIRKVQGCLRGANVIYNKALDFISEHELERTPHGIKIISGYGQLMLYWHEINKAKTFFNKAIELASQTDILYAYTAYQNLCEAYVRENNIQSAFDVLHELRQHVRGKEDLYEKIHLQHTLALETRLAIEAGDISHAVDWVETCGFENIPANKLFAYYGYELGMILPIAAKTYLLNGNYEEAIKVLKAVIPKFIHQGANSYLIRALGTLALVYDQIDQPQKSINTITKAIILAEPENNLGDLIFVGRSLIPILSESLHHGISPEFTTKLIVQLRQASQKDAINNAKSDRPALSQREIDVLKLIEEGLTNRQIALSLYLSTNTIKSHSLSIYRKLNVENRNQAVNKARCLGILPKIQSEPGLRYSQIIN